MHVDKDNNESAMAMAVSASRLMEQLFRIAGEEDICPHCLMQFAFVWMMDREETDSELHGRWASPEELKETINNGLIWLGKKP